MPRRGAAFRLARPRSTIKLRSRSASTPIVCHMARRVGVVVAIASVIDWKAIPRSRSSSNGALSDNVQAVGGWSPHRFGAKCAICVCPKTSEAIRDTIP